MLLIFTIPEQITFSLIVVYIIQNSKQNHETVNDLQSKIRAGLGIRRTAVEGQAVVISLGREMVRSRKMTRCEGTGGEIDDDDNTLTRRIWSKLDRRLLLVIREHVRLLPNLIRTQFVNVFYLKLRLDLKNSQARLFHPAMF